MLSRSGKFAWVMVLGVSAFGALAFQPSSASADQRFYQCDRDGDRCRLVECDWDGDDCHVLREERREYYQPYQYYQPPVVSFYWSNGDRHGWRHRHHEWRHGDDDW